MKIQIKCRFSRKVLFEYENENNSIKLTLEAAIKARADLSGADLSRAYLYGADLSRTDLSRADLSGAYLSRAYLYDKDNPISDIKQIGNIGSRGGFTLAFKCKKSIQINCGCFWGTLDEFEKAVKKTHSRNKHGKEYKAMIEFLKKIWVKEKIKT